jgi:putative ABC transport system permease protein
VNPAVPTWAGVAASLALVAVAAAVAFRRRLHLAREITVAAARAGIGYSARGPGRAEAASLPATVGRRP